MARNWSQEEVAARMEAYGYDFHQTMIAKIEAAQRPLRVRELADFAALYGVEVQDLVYPPTSSLSATDQEIAEVTASRDMAQARATQASRRLEEASRAMRDAEAAYQASLAEATALDGRLASLRAVREKLIGWESDEYSSPAEGSDRTGRDSSELARTSIASRAGGPAVLRILLGAQLRRLRQAKQLTAEDAGAAIRVSGSKILKLETGQVGFKDRDIADLLTLFGVTDEDDLRALRSLARRANAPGWWHDYSDILPSWFEPYVGLEEAATHIRAYEVQFVPGLLQTEDYARAVTLLSHAMAPPREVERRVRLRMARQAVLDRPDPPHLWVVLDEAVLRRPLGSSAVMQGQFKHLAEMALRPDVTIQVIPFRVGGHSAPGGSFTILRFAEFELPDVVYLEQLASALYLDTPGAVDSHQKAMDRLAVEALTPSKTMQLLKQLLK